MSGVSFQQAFFSTMSHQLYDFGLYRIVTQLFWRCPTERLLENYVQNISGNHLELGVGSGYFLARTLCPEYVKRLVLLDLNPQCLGKSGQRLSPLHPVLLHHDICEPLQQEDLFESVGMNYVLHCMPGPLSHQQTFQNVHSLLQPGGVFFGATLVPHAPHQTTGSEHFMGLLNKMGIFKNDSHTSRELRARLEDVFATVEIEMVGDACVFRAIK